MTIEYDPALARRAQANLTEAGVDAVAQIAQADALAWLAKTTARYDFVFMDIEKEDYVKALPHCERILSANGLLVAYSQPGQGAHFAQIVTTGPQPVLGGGDLLDGSADGSTLLFRFGGWGSASRFSPPAPVRPTTPSRLGSSGRSRTCSRRTR